MAFVLALVNLAKRAASPAIDVLEANGNPGDSLLAEAPAGAVTAPGVVVVRMAAPLFFANGEVFSDAVKKAVEAAGTEQVDHLVIDMEAVTDIDVTAAESFGNLRRWLDAQHVALAYSRVRPDAKARLEHLGMLAGEPVFGTNRAAIAALTTTPQPGEPSPGEPPPTETRG